MILVGVENDKIVLLKLKLKKNTIRRLLDKDIWSFNT